MNANMNITNIVLDTNILVGACMGSRPSSCVIKACFQGKFVPMLSSALVTEYEDVINRNSLFKNSHLNNFERNQLLDILFSVSQFQEIYYLWRPNLHDEGDNHVIDLAIASNAQYLITRNLRDFTRAELKFPELIICTPEDFIQWENLLC